MVSDAFNDDVRRVLASVQRDPHVALPEIAETAEVPSRNLVR